MTTRQTVAAVVGAAVLAVAGFAGADQLGVTPLSATATTDTVTLPPVPCTANTTRGTVADACTVEITKWQQEFHNGLGTNTYYPKWKAANPGEYGRLRDWGTSDPSNPQPVVATGYGAVVRYGLGQCRTWAVDLGQCVLP